jgi:chromosome segregation ATPase
MQAITDTAAARRDRLEQSQKLLGNE